ncbi:thiol:disulfide interchange protein DsbA/DsbL [Lysobacter sp. TY2-98]|uniref:thiol:disulfide interchange protein DsbA/DsbL n=1 Tax=Lysobacter sp. TY2-98 TaxID=2290922 RepID=UPI000E208857|nr:thiol:disulfide interchange protein DsbA/DsbL [Lysobacter sp. TY2-98]AXK70835.1 thiol:disulfide interchange protein DsbA/DsbL [Lysobacter sp. TY2-98]
MNLLLRLAAIALLALPITSIAATAPRTPVQGEDYEVIDDGAPYQSVKGTVEVAEVFGYPCSHCAHFEPTLEAWVKTLPKQARFVAVPADFRDAWIPFARAYFAAQSLGIAQRSHAAMYTALHDEQSLPMSDASPEEIATFYQRYGIAPARFIAAYNAATVDAQMKHAHDFIVRSEVDGTPTIIVAGRYKVTTNSREGQLATAMWLVKRELATPARR